MASDQHPAGALHGAVLFTPGDRPERFDKGWAAGGGQLILDLEDAVSPEHKGTARAAVAQWVRESGNRPLLRVNAVDSVFFQGDCSALGGLALRGIVAPKVNDVGELDAVRVAWPGVDLFPLIETPEGLENAPAIGHAAGVRQLMLGALDLHAECGIEFPHAALMQHARVRLVLASRIARLAAPVDSPNPAVRELDTLRQDAAAAAALGFEAKLCIHPAQVQPVNEGFAPAAELVDWACEVLAAAESIAAAGAVQVRGRMVDAPVVVSARRIVARAGL